jgi:NADH-quinone oxidoreductase subunit N
VNDSIVNALTGFLPHLVPETILGVAACVLFLGGTWQASRRLWGSVALIALALAALALGYSYFGAPGAPVRERIAESRADLLRTRQRAAELQQTHDKLRQSVAALEKSLTSAKLPAAARNAVQARLTEIKGSLAQLDAQRSRNDAEQRNAAERLKKDIDKVLASPLGATTVEDARDYLAHMREYAKQLPAPERGSLEGDLRAREKDLQAVVYASPILPTRLALLLKLIAIVGGAVLVLFSFNEMPADQAAEYHACVLLTVAGVCLVGMANELVTLFLALELTSIPTYVLLYLPRVDAKAQEAALKYFLLSIFSSALLLFGFSYLYGVAGTTNIPAITEGLTRARTELADAADGQRTAAAWQGLTLVALVMVVAALGFRITAVPFHFYAPDVYQGTTTGAAAFLAFVPKVAGFAALLRVLGFVPAALAAGTGDAPRDVGLALGEQVPWLFWIMAAVTMSLGNLLALLQNNVKRILAYSSVAHAGYMLIGLAAAPRLGDAAGGSVGGVEAVLFYLVAYGAMTVGAFAVLHYLSTPERPVETVDDLAGVARSRPGVALLMVLFLFSLIGIPLTAGFAGKFLLFFDAVGLSGAPEVADPTNLDRQQSVELYRLFVALAVLGMINAAVGAWYYLRIAGVMFLGEPIRPLRPATAPPVMAAIWACAALTLFFGVYPTPLLRAVRDAVPHRAAVPAAGTARLGDVP